MIRDNFSKAILNTDKNELDKYRLEKQKTNRISQLEKDVRDLKLQLTDIQSSLKEK